MSIVRQFARYTVYRSALCRTLLSSTATSIVLLPLVLASSSQATPAKEGNRFEWMITDDVTHKSAPWQEIILRVDQDKILIRSAETENSGFSVTTLDKQFRILESGAWEYDPGQCTGIPAVLEVGKSRKFDVAATYTNLQANTKDTTKMRCVSKVVGVGTRVVDGMSLDVFMVENVAEYNMRINGAPATFGISGVYAPKLGWWVERTFKETQRGVVTNKRTWVLQHYGKAED